MVLGFQGRRLWLGFPKALTILYGFELYFYKCLLVMLAKIIFVLNTFN